LKQASLVGYTICPVEGLTTATTTRRVRCTDVISPASSHVAIDNDVTTNRNSNAKRCAGSINITDRGSISDVERSRQQTSAQNECHVSAGEDVKRPTSSERRQLRDNDDDDDRRLQATSSDNVVDTADICNCSPSFGGRQPGLAASRRHLADVTSTTSSIAAGEVVTTQC